MHNHHSSKQVHQKTVLQKTQFTNHPKKLLQMRKRNNRSTLDLVSIIMFSVVLTMVAMAFVLKVRGYKEYNHPNIQGEYYQVTHRN